MHTTADALRRQGVVVLRGALRPACVSAILAELKCYFDPMRAPFGETPIDRARRESGVVSVPQALAAGFPGLLAIVPAIAASPICGVLCAYFADGVHTPLAQILLRHYHAGNGYRTVAGFHQDLTGADRRATLTSWIPLVDCGIEAPGLEWVDAPIDGALPEIGEAAVLSRYGGRLAHPAFAAGDAVLMRNTVPHRTFVSAAMTRPRYSIDLRFLPAAALTAADQPEDFPKVGSETASASLSS
jgi:hypothetical protein